MAKPLEGSPLDPRRTPFFKWALSAAFRLRTAVGIGAIFVATLTIRNFFPFLLPSHWIVRGLADLKEQVKGLNPTQVDLAVVQAVACLLLATMTPRPSLLPLRDLPANKLNEGRAAAKSADNVHKYIVALFLSWFCTMP